jgi:hypothetical protein
MMAWVRPLLLLDVDGVLMPTGRSVPSGYRRVTTERYDAVICDRHGEWLRSLTPLFDLVWATTWGLSAPLIFGELLGLPPMAVLDLGKLGQVATRKLPAVAAYVGEHPIAWVDDELFEDAAAWASTRVAPTLLVRTRGSVGLAEPEVEEIRRYGESFQSEGGP